MNFKHMTATATQNNSSNSIVFCVCRFFMPHGIEVDTKGNIWLTDVALHQVGFELY